MGDVGAPVTCSAGLRTPSSYVGGAGAAVGRARGPGSRRGLPDGEAAAPWTKDGEVLVDEDFDRFFWEVVLGRGKAKAGAEDEAQGTEEGKAEKLKRTPGTRTRRPVSAKLNREREASRIEAANANILARLRAVSRQIDTGNAQRDDDDNREDHAAPLRLAHETYDAQRELRRHAHALENVAAEPTRDQPPRAFRLFWEEGRHWRGGADANGDTPVGARTKREVRERGRDAHIAVENARMQSRLARARGGWKAGTDVDAYGATLDARHAKLPSRLVGLPLRTGEKPAVQLLGTMRRHRAAAWAARAKASESVTAAAAAAWNWRLLAHLLRRAEAARALAALDKGLRAVAERRRAEADAAAAAATQLPAPPEGASRREAVAHGRKLAEDARAARIKELQEARRQRAQAAFLLEHGATPAEFGAKRRKAPPCAFEGRVNTTNAPKQVGRKGSRAVHYAHACVV